MAGPGSRHAYFPNTHYYCECCGKNLWDKLRRLKNPNTCPDIFIETNGDTLCQKCFGTSPRERRPIVEKKIKAAWKALRMPKLDQMQVVREHGRWWVIGWDDEEDRRTFSVVEATGPGTYKGIAFEE
jgi:hypothetical protein